MVTDNSNRSKNKSKKMATDKTNNSNNSKDNSIASITIKEMVNKIKILNQNNNKNRDSSELSIFNFFKIYSLLFEYRIVFINIFKFRWSEETLSKWQSNDKFGSLLINNIQNEEIYKSFKEDQKKQIKSGRLEEWDLELIATILKIYNYKKMDRAEMEAQNKKILTIKLYYLKVLKLRELKHFYLDEGETSKIMSIINDSFSLIDISAIGDNIVGILDFYESVVKDDNYNEEEFPGYQNTKSQIKTLDKYCKDMNKTILDIVNVGEEEKLDSFKMGIKFGIDNFTKDYTSSTIKAKMHCIKSSMNMAIFKYYTFKDDMNHIQKNKSLIMEAREDAIDAIVSKFVYYEGYYRLGETYKVVGDYHMAIKLYEIAIGLDPSQDCLYTAREIALKRLSERVYDPLTGERDFHQEALNFVKEHDFINTGFVDGASYDKIELNNEPFKTIYRKALRENKIYGCKDKYLIEGVAYQCDALHSIANKNEYQAYKSFCKAATYNLSFSYLFLSEFHRAYSSVKCDEVPKDPFKELVLLFQSSLALPTPKLRVPSNPNLEEQFDSNLPTNYCKVASKFFYGINGLDMDLDRSLYYFDKSIDNLELNGTLKFAIFLMKFFEDPFFKCEKDEMFAHVMLKSLASKSSEKGRLVYSYLDGLKKNRVEILDYIHNDGVKNNKAAFIHTHFNYNNK
ncbi:hypothetical protein DICPUDRAFT_156111 [Dictyostelium purpureum]|uniref:Uncharacterized protein n=1 Tax=Dictyostelium purpureum TaxID=5786 RepID=F0ZVR2_DICPU|nr:uncharacterized protein DICPUDRAFT_156111 [Dictyostelium purpureum]EGC31972.1 hypothetical protein DICPUDRAFT_156111 [Dictyostelium purpureum]|eukprot:XP_003291508.1 hypothetical protein DICPUDRAFT_156111 [Dictyostelium purpureum]